MPEDEVRASLTDDDTLLPMCRLIEYNESIPEEQQSAQDKIDLFGKPHAIPAHLTLYRERANTAMNNYVGYRTAFRECSPNASSIIRIALGLHMTIDEINSVLLSYDLQTISWHRVDDILLRCAVSKRWTYQAFSAALSAYRKEAEDSQPDAAAEEESALMSDSAYVTRMNISLFNTLIAESETDTAAIIKKLHALFAASERACAGAPRRTFLRTIRFTQGSFPESGFADDEEDEEEEDDLQDAGARVRRAKLPACPPGKVNAAFYLMHEAAGMLPPAALPDNARKTINQVISAIDDMLCSKDHVLVEPIKEPKSSLDEGSMRRYQAELLEARRKRTLTPATIRDRASCEMILRTISRDFPQNIRLNPYPSAPDDERIMRQMIDVASIVQNPAGAGAQEESCRSSLFRLLLCCGCKKARNQLDAAVMDILRSIGMTVLPEAPREIAPKAQTMALASAMQYTPSQIRRLESALTELDDSAVKAYTRNVLQPQYVTERYVKDQLSSILDLFDPRRRNSEPSRVFLMLLAYYTFGFALRGDPRAFRREQAHRYVRQCLKNAWDVSFMGIENDDVLSQTVHQLVDDTFGVLNQVSMPDASIGENWVAALTKVCSDHREKARESEIAALERCIRIKRTKDVSRLTCSNPLMSVKLVSGGWEY